MTRSTEKKTVYIEPHPPLRRPIKYPVHENPEYYMANYGNLKSIIILSTVARCLYGHLFLIPHGYLPCLLGLHAFFLFILS